MKAQSDWATFVEQFEKSICSADNAIFPDSTVSDSLMSAASAPVFGASIDLDELFRELDSGGHNSTGTLGGTNYEVIARPGERFDEALLQGDILIRKGLGERGLGHAAVVADSHFFSDNGNDLAGYTKENNLQGRYVQVIEGGLNPHLSSDMYLRRLLDHNGRLPPEQLLLRKQAVHDQTQLDRTTRADDRTPVDETTLDSFIRQVEQRLQSVQYEGNQRGMPILRQGQYAIHIRSFVPSNGGTGASAGIGRHATTSLDARSLINFYVVIDVEKEEFARKDVWSDYSLTGVGSQHPNDAAIEINRLNQPPPYEKMLCHFSGAGRAVARIDLATADSGVSALPNVDLVASIEVQKSLSMIHVRAVLSGDAFPNAEIFIQDCKNNRIFITTFAISPGSPVGDLYWLLQEKNRRPMGEGSVSVGVDDKGVFKKLIRGRSQRSGPRSNISLDNWNAYFMTTDDRMK